MDEIFKLYREINNYHTNSVEVSSILVGDLVDADSFTEDFTKSLLTKVKVGVTVSQRHWEVLVALESKIWERDELAVSKEDLTNWRGLLILEDRRRCECADDHSLYSLSRLMARAAVMKMEDYNDFVAAQRGGASAANVLRYSRSPLARLAIFVDGLAAVCAYSAGYESTLHPLG